jgi:hypothetical protein
MAKKDQQERKEARMALRELDAEARRRLPPLRSEVQAAKQQLARLEGSLRDARQTLATAERREAETVADLDRRRQPHQTILDGDD